MEPLDPLVPPPDEPYIALTDRDSHMENVSRQSWRGRKVSVQEMEDQATSGPTDTNGAGLKDRLNKRYGHYIQERVAGSIAPETELSQRDVKALEGQAISLLNNVQADNKKHLKQWIKDGSSSGLVARQFEHIAGYQWDTVSKHEQQLMVDGVKTVLAQAQVELDRTTAENLASEYLRHHLSHFSRHCSRTSEFLLEHTDLEPPILSGHLQDWANYQKTELTENDRKLVSNFHILTNKSLAILASSSLEDSTVVGVQDQIESVNQLSMKLMQCSNEIYRYREHLPTQLCRAMELDLNQQLIRVNEYKRLLEVNAAGDPRRLEQRQKMRLTELQAAQQVFQNKIAALDELSKTKTLSSKQNKKLEKWQAANDKLSGHINEVRAGKPARSPVTGKMFALNLKSRGGEQKASDYRKEVIKFLRQHGIGKSEAGKKLGHYREELLKKTGFEPIKKAMVVQINGETFDCVSEITPAAYLTIDVEDRPDSKKGDYDVFPVQYKKQGIPSSSRKESTHAVNLNETRLEVEGEKCFRGLRSATLSAFGIKDKEQRMKANRNRARELVVAAVRMQIDRDDDSKDDVLHHSVIPVKLFSTSLLSPDFFRHYTHFHDDELTMQQEQVQALQEVIAEIMEDKEGTVIITESNGDHREVQVDLELITCNFGVNEVSLNPVRRRLMGAWGAAGAENAQALHDLLGSVEPGDKIDGWVGDFLEDCVEEERQVVIELVEQIRSLYVTEAYKKEEDDAYKMIERLQLLAYKIGAVPHFNCKSGKDRTGEADAAIKRFATQVAVNGFVPDPGLPMNREEQILAQQFVYNTGNIELQQNNLNLPGYKTKTGKAQLGEVVFKMTHKPQFPDDFEGGNLGDDEDETPL